MSTDTTTADATTEQDWLGDAQRATEHADAASLAVIRPEQQRFDDNQRAILRQLGIENATEGDLDLFFHVCRTTGLDPFRKQIYMIGRNTLVKEWVDDDRAQNGRRQIERWVTKYTIQTGIDGYRRNVREAAKTLGDDLRLDGPYFTGANDFHITDDGEVIQHWRKVWPEQRPPHAARFVVIRNGEQFEGIAHFDEFVQTGRNNEPNSMWRKMPRNQIAKCAEGLAYRRAYPDDLSGLILEDTAQPTVIDQDGQIVSQGRARATTPARSAPVSVDDILVDEVPVPEPARGVTPHPHTMPDPPQAPAGDVTEDQGDGPADPEPSPAEQPETVVDESAKLEAEGKAVAEKARAAIDAEAKSTSKKVAAKRSTAPAADPDRPKSRMRQALEKRLFALLGDAGISGDADRDGRIAVYRAVLDRPDIESTDDLDDPAVGKVADQLYAWQQQNELDDQIAGILSDAARESESAAPAADPTSEGDSEQ